MFRSHRIDELVALMAPEHALDVTAWGQYGAAQNLTEAIEVVLHLLPLI